MTLGEIIQRVDALKPNAYPAVSKVLWISELEGMIQSQILLLSAADTVTYDVTTPLDTKTVLDADAVGLYTAYLVAMIDLYNGEFDRYNNTISLFNTRFGDYMRRYASLVHDGREAVVLSAYALACKHGFTGDEETWLRSLRADPVTVTEASSPLFLEDGVSYRLSDVSELEMICPDGHFSCHLLLQTAAQGSVSLTVIGARFSDAGYCAASNGETWEISITDGCVLSRLWEVSP